MDAEEKEKQQILEESTKKTDSEFEEKKRKEKDKHEENKRKLEIDYKKKIALEQTRNADLAMD